MNGRHERIYRGYLVVIDLTRRDNDVVGIRITTRDMETGIAGPSASYSVLFYLDLLGDAAQKIRTSLDHWLSDQDLRTASSTRDS